MSMTHKQRVEAALAHKETDRLPYSLWMHFPNRDRHPRRLAELCHASQQKYDLDFIKFMPFGMFTTIDYGVDLKLFPGFNDAPVAAEPLIRDVKDWDRIGRVCGTEGEFAVVLEAQRLLRGMQQEKVPFLMTLFSPMTTAAKLCSPEVLVQHLRTDPRRVHRALEMITETTIEFARGSMDLGADGFFFATQMSCTDMVTPAELDSFVKAYDLEVLATVKDRTWFNVCHLHGANVYIKESQDYPVQGLSWHDRDSGPSMAEVRTYSDKAFVGGLSQGCAWLSKTKEEVVAEVKDVAGRGKGVILAPGCVIEPATPVEFLEAIHQTVLATAR